MINSNRPFLFLKKELVTKAGAQICLYILFFLILLPAVLPSKCLSKTTPHSIKKLTGPVYMVTINSSINPGAFELLNRAIVQARTNNASCLIIILDTPGGLVATLRKMVQAIMQSTVPVIVYVYPPGAQAASAGAILTLAADIAAMAPGTNIGAAHPVSPGQDLDSNSTMGQKMENDLAALAISIAKERGRNVKWAEEAVRKSRSVSATTALKLDVVDLVAKDVQDLLNKVKGMLEMANGEHVQLNPDDSKLFIVKENLREKVLRTIADPNIAYILMMIGMVGLYFELAHPGTILPGTAGAISLILSFYALQTLSASITGIVLIILAFFLFVLELFITSHGILAISGVISLAFGSIMLFNQTPGISVSSSVLWPTLITVSALLSAIIFLAAKATLSRPKTGPEGLIGQEGIVKQVHPDGSYTVFVHGELWKANCSLPIRTGEKIIIESVKGLTLIINPVEE